MPPRRTSTPRARQSKPKAPSITFMGAEYRIAEKVGVWPLMQFARAAESGATLAESRGLAAAHAFLQDVIHEDDWGRFQEDMIDKKADDLQALLDMARQAIERLTEKQGKKAGSNGLVQGEVES